MKKVLSFVLVLSMILGSFGMAFAAPADVVSKDYVVEDNAWTNTTLYTIDFCIKGNVKNKIANIIRNDFLKRLNAIPADKNISRIINNKAHMVLNMISQ